MKPSGQTAGENGYQKNTKQLLRAELRQGKYPPGGQAKPWESTLKRSLKQCYKAADSWATTAWKYRLVATEAWGQVHKQLRKHPGGRPSEMKQQALPAGPPWPPGLRGRGQWHRHIQTYCGRKHTSHQPAQDRGANRIQLAEIGSMPSRHLLLSWTLGQHCAKFLKELPNFSLCCRPREREVGNALHR